MRFAGLLQFAIAGPFERTIDCAPIFTFDPVVDLCLIVTGVALPRRLGIKPQALGYGALDLAL
jgi:hypothetical protein